MKQINITISESEANLLLASLMTSHTRYSTEYNGGKVLRGTFSNASEQNQYANLFKETENKIREQLKTQQ